MKMNSGIKSSDLWEKITVDDNFVIKSIQHAKKDLKTAKSVFNSEDYDWCYSIAYNSMLQAGRALMFSSGVRPTGDAKHISVIEFLKSNYNRELDDILYIFNKMRQKRHLIMYDEIELITKEEAENGLKNAELFIKNIEKLIK